VSSLALAVIGSVAIYALPNFNIVLPNFSSFAERGAFAIRRGAPDGEAAAAVRPGSRPSSSTFRQTLYWESRGAQLLGCG